MLSTLPIHFEATINLGTVLHGIITAFIIFWCYKGICRRLEPIEEKQNKLLANKKKLT
jgi:uncharacterized membrane protein YczE